MHIVHDVQVVSQSCTAVKGQATEREWGGDLSTEVGGLVMTPAIQLAGDQLLAGVMPTHPPHVRLGPSVQWVPLQYKDTLWTAHSPSPVRRQWASQSCVWEGVHGAYGFCLRCHLAPLKGSGT